MTWIESALEATFQHMVDLAVSCGWDRTESIAAFQELAFAHLAADEENEKTALAIQRTGVTTH